VKLSTQLSGLVGIPAFNWNYPFKIFQYLPNPAYLGIEKQNPEQVQFEPQKG